MKIIESPTKCLTRPILELLGVFSLIISSSFSFTSTPNYSKNAAYSTFAFIPTSTTTFTTNKNMNTVSSSTKLYNNKGHDFFDDTWGWNNNNPPSNNNNNNSSGGGAGAGGNRNKNGGSNGGKDVFNMEELKARISSLKQSKSVAAPASSGLASSVKTSTDTPPPAKKPDEVHIILFNPDTEQEGVHTIEFPKGSGNNVILAFENAQACDMFSKLLKDQLYMDPIPQKMKLEFLEDYCTTLGVSVQLIPDGMNIRPPKENAESLGMNPVLKENIATLESIYSLPSTISFQDGANNGSGDTTSTGSSSNVHPKNEDQVNVVMEQEEEDDLIMMDGGDLVDDVRFVLLSDTDSWGVWE